MAVFADLQFSYNNMLFLGLTGRNDWSTTMPEENVSAFYPSFSLGFVFSEIAGLKDSSFLSFGKLRASAARTANIASAYNTSNFYIPGGTGDGWTDGVGFPFAGQTGFEVNYQLGNPDLRHETQDSWEVGTDLRFYSNRYGIDFTYFNNLNKDLLLAVPLAPSSGYQQIYMNAGVMETKGIEVSFNANPIKSDKFNWNLQANFSKFSNIVTELSEGVENVGLPGGFTVPNIRAVVGEEYGSIFGFDWYRDENGNVLINDDPTDGMRDGYPMPDERQMVAIGNSNPDWTANITNSFKYKNLGLSFLFDIKSGGMMYNGTAYAMNFMGTSARTENREVYYTSEGTIDFDLTPAENIVIFDGVYGHIDGDGNPISSGVTNVTPIVQDERWFEGQGSNFGGGPSVAAMEPADWVRLRDITISYDLSNLSDFIKDTQIYFTGKNLWLLTPYTGIDPETSLSGSGNGQGMDYFNNPGTKSYSLGVKMSF